MLSEAIIKRKYNHHLERACVENYIGVTYAGNLFRRTISIDLNHEVVLASSSILRTH